MRGASLVEVVVAGFVLGLFLLFSLRPLVSANQATELNKERQQREFLAHQILKRAVLVPASELRPLNGRLDSPIGPASTRNLEWALRIEDSETDRVPLTVQVTDPVSGNKTTLGTVRFVSGGYSNE
jgi:hypothetical protein